MKKITVLFVLLFSMMLNAQVGVNTTTPDPSSMLDITATNKGVLVPRVSLANVTTTMLDGTNTAATGLLIWNTNATTLGGNGIGFYYFNGSQWMPITQTITGNTLDQSYDQGGAGAGKNIDASDGAVRINGDDGFLVTGTIGTGNTIDTEITGTGIRMFFNPRKGAFRSGRANGNVWDDSNIGNYSTAFGSGTTASGGNSSAFGSGTASGESSTAFGWSTTASGTSSVAFGTGTTASNWHSTAFGYNTTASGLASAAFGYETLASGFYSTAFGFNNHAPSFSEIVIGIGATTYTPSFAGNSFFRSANATDRLFVIGNAIDFNNNNIVDDTERRDALVVLKNGNTGLGNSTPQERLHVVGNIRMVDGNQAVGRVMKSNATGTAFWQDDNDNQNLSLVGNNLSISNGNTINLSSVNTDNQNIQNLAFNTLTNVLTVGIENGTSQTVSLASLATGGDITAVSAGAGLVGGGTTGAVTITAAANNGLNVDAIADNIQLGGPLVENTTISQGIYSMNINLNGTGDFSIQDNGTDVFFVEDTGDIGIGTSNPAYPLHIVESVAGTTNSVYIDKSDNSASNTSGLYIQKTGTGTGRSHAIFTSVDGAGVGQKYGLFNNINSSADGNQYGTRNFINSATSSFIFGTFNNLDNAGTGNQYGVYNGMRGVAAANLYGTYNEFNSASVASETAGVRNTFSDGSTGTNGMMGVFTDFSNPSDGTYYGVRNSFTATAVGTGTKYGTYNLISTAAGGTHYGTYNSVEVANGWAGYFIGKNYISDRLSIGLTDNPNAGLNVNKNSTGTYSHIELTETTVNDGARVRFNNSVESNSHWILFGRADDTDADSQFNIYHSVAGDILRLRGSGRVGIMRNPATNALEVAGDASKTTAGGWLANSDSRLKKDIATISPNEALNKILKLRGVTYHWNDDKTGTTRPENLQMGFIAQEIAEVFPEKVTEDNLGYLQTAYGDYDPIVFQAIKALNDKIEKLENENAALKSALEKINILEAKLEQMNIK